MLQASSSPAVQKSPGDKEKPFYDGGSSPTPSTKPDDDMTDFAAITEKERARVLRKLDLHLLPFVSLLYLLSFL